MGSSNKGGRIYGYWDATAVTDYEAQLCQFYDLRNSMIAFRINDIAMPEEAGYVEMKPRLYSDDGSFVDFNSYNGLKIGGTYGDHKFTYTNDFTTFDDALDVGRDFIVKSDYIQLRVVPKTTQQDGMIDISYKCL